MPLLSFLAEEMIPSQISKLFLFCLLFFLPFISFSQKGDTLIDSHYAWTELQQKMIAFYTDTTKNKMSRYQRQTAIRFINENLSLVNVVYKGFDERVHAGQIICHRLVADDIKNIFGKLLQIGFPIFQCKPITEYYFNDIQSMQANNTNGFDFRLKTGNRTVSKHSYGLAIDINPVENPYQKGEEILPYNNNENFATGRIRTTDEKGRKVIAIFKKRGWIWGGGWHSLRDYMHFEKR